MPCSFGLSTPKALHAKSRFHLREAPKNVIASSRSVCGRSAYR